MRNLYEQWLLYDKVFNKDLRYNNIIANGIKNKLNELYGEGNYIVIPIGRSLSSVGKCLGYKIGEDKVKSLPMSSAGRFLDLEKCKDEDFDAFREYLNSIGLSKNDVTTSGKKYIFMDYCCRGVSLKGVENLFKSDKIYENLDNIEFVNIVKFLKKTKLEKSTEDFFPNMNTLIDDIECGLYRSSFKPYSVVKECHRLSNTKDSVIKPEDYKFETRIFLFKLLDNEMNKSSQLKVK